MRLARWESQCAFTEMEWLYELTQKFSGVQGL